MSNADVMSFQAPNSNFQGEWNTPLGKKQEVKKQIWRKQKT